MMQNMRGKILRNRWEEVVSVIIYFRPTVISLLFNRFVLGNLGFKLLHTQPKQPFLLYSVHSVQVQRTQGK
jgi:hypothetical protein